MRKFLMMAYTIISFIRREIILTGLRPFKLPHEGLRPLDPCWEGPCGAEDSATCDCDNLNDYLSRAHGYNDLSFSQITMSARRLCRHNPPPQKWAKV